MNSLDSKLLRDFVLSLVQNLLDWSLSLKFSPVVLLLYLIYVCHGYDFMIFRWTTFMVLYEAPLQMTVISQKTLHPADLQSQFNVYFAGKNKLQF